MTRVALEREKYAEIKKPDKPLSGEEIEAILQDKLVNVFRKKAFKPLQKEACAEALKGKDILACFPTGYGKSLLYQLPAVAACDGGVTLVISPLLALMADQVRALCEIGIDARLFNSSVATHQRMSLMNELMTSNVKVKLLFVAPEGLSNTALMLCLEHLHRKGKFARMVVDEAHCISSWGHQFRPAYRKLSWLKRKFELPITALTATATRRVQDDICLCLRLNAVKFIGSTRRNELFYEVANKGTDSESQRDVSKYIQKIKRNTLKDCDAFSGIVYCHTRDQCHVMAQVLSNGGVVAKAYHAGLGVKERARVQQAWMEGAAEVVCATVSFGMGIDKTNVRVVVHYSLSNSLESYYQEAGRAGRDGKRAFCRLYYCTKDAETRRYLLMKELQLQKDKNRKRKSTADTGSDKRVKSLNRIGKITDAIPTEESANNDIEPAPEPTGELTNSRDAIQSLNRMIRYCETLKCRHVAFSAHLGDLDDYSLQDCKLHCDVCAEPDMASLNLKLIKAENKRPFNPSPANRAALPPLSNMDHDLVALERYDRSLQEEDQAVQSIEKYTKLSDPTVTNNQTSTSERDRLFGSRRRTSTHNTQQPVLSSAIPKDCEIVEPVTRPEVPSLDYRLRTRYLDQAKIAIDKHVNSLKDKGISLPSADFQREVAAELEYLCFDGVKTISAYKTRFLKLLKGLKEASSEGVLYDQFL